MGRKRKWTPEPGAGQPWRPSTPSPFYAEPPGRPAEEPPTRAFRSPPPARGARPYPPRPPERLNPPPPRRTEPLYEHYDTDGYPPGVQPPRDEETHHSRLEAPSGVPRLPKKITVTRVAALRSRELGGKAVGVFQRATRADGADKSGLAALTYAVMLNYASDATMAVALANTLFFAATSGESRGRVALYLLITIAPFALVAPVIGPALDRIQRGRRLAMCLSSLGQGLMAVLMALHFDDWGLYPAALGMMVLSKSYTVLKSAVAPRVVPPEITLSKTNARLTVFGLAAGGVFGGIASGVNALTGPAGALWFTALVCVAAAVQSMRIPSWVEVTEGEVPTSLNARPGPKKRQPLSPDVVLSLWGNAAIRVLTGFLMMFAAFAVKAHAESTGQTPFTQLLLLGVIGAAAGIGGFAGNALGSRLHFGHPGQVVIGSLAAALGSTVLATVLAGIATAAVVGLVGATASALAKISLDAVIQTDLPEQSRASAFGRSETVLQLAWCLGGAIGLLLPPIYWVGFLVVSLLLALGLTQTVLLRRGGSLVSWATRRRAEQPVRTTGS
ncbi:MFS transporter [Amycolatopsis rhizosphaerae]|uniref:MFS transporter n=1 Tax=Amycolatopsis rhizosphaerae TaxID=2053003 RepID=A0A558D977_9PSEU|nr:MFS transporter [Amycolatopsis rhizosphaerae]TVT57561.1 MFS transporter [Amycolatopsis rhizosphaerae]